MRRLLYFLLLIISTACSTLSLEHDVPVNLGIKNTIERARVLSQITWVPLMDVAYNTGDIYPSGIPVNGTPYSSVKETQTYIGHDVSLYTFLTATMNPYSLFYTESIDKYPYRGTNCKLYYGVVCSSAVMYALGVTLPYSTYLFKESELFVKCSRQFPEDIFLGSILLEPGHMLMVVGIERDQDRNIYTVDLFEASQHGTHIFRIPFERFCERWITNGIVQYEYRYIMNNAEIATYDTDVDIQNYGIYLRKIDICPHKGDKSSYLAGDDVVVNVFNTDKYDRIELYKNDTLISTDNISSVSDGKVIFSDLMPGEYSVRLIGDSTVYSNWAHFEILDVSTEIDVQGDKIYVKPRSVNAALDFVSLNSAINGAARSYYDITEMEDEFCIPLPTDNKEDTVLRVVYRGKYGRLFYQYELI